MTMHVNCMKRLFFGNVLSDLGRMSKCECQIACPGEVLVDSGNVE